MAVDLYKLKLAAEKAEAFLLALQAVDEATLAIQAITPNLSNLNIVATNLPNINAVASNEDAINAVNANQTNIDTIVSIQEMLASIYADVAKLTSLYNDKAKLDSLHADKATLDALFGMKATLDSLFADKTALASLYADKTKLDALYGIIAQMQALYANIDTMTTNAQNIVAIQNALQNATDALNAKDQTLIYRNQAEGFKNEAQAIAGGTIVASNVQFSDLLSLEVWRTNTANAINTINTLLASNDTNLDDIQELVDFIKANKATLDTLGIGNIAGLQTALDAKSTEIAAHANNVANPHGVTKAQVGLSNVDNTSDALKPLSEAVIAALALKAPLVNPTFTGTPTAPTPTNGDNSTKIATTAFVLANASTPDATETTKGKVELATNAEVQAGTDTTRVVTPAGLFSTLVKSHGTSGYQKLPNGLIIQWGALGVQTANAQVTVTFPIAFPSRCGGMIAQGIWVDAANPVTPNLRAHPSVSSGVVQIPNGNNISFDWIAIGY